MTDITEIEKLIQESYGAEGYHVSRVTGKTVIVTLPASGQDLDNLIVELRGRGCSINFETLSDDGTPKVEMYVHPGTYHAVSDDEPDEAPPQFVSDVLGSRGGSLNSHRPHSPVSSRPKERHPWSSYVCCGILLVFCVLLLLLLIFVLGPNPK